MKFTSRLAVVTLAMLFTLAVLPAVTVTCPDGSVIGLTPFNQSNPCRLARPVSGPVIPPDVLEYFGPFKTAADFPTAPNPSDSARAARQDYEFLLANWGGFVDVPKGFTSDQVAKSSAVAAYYGMGAVKFYTHNKAGFTADVKTGKVTRGPETLTLVLGSPVEFHLKAGLFVGYPHLAVSSWQMRMIDQGHPVELEHPFLPEHVKKANQRLKEMGANGQ